MGPQGTMGAVVEGAAPEAADLAADQRLHAREHRPGGLVREGGEQDPLRRDAAFDETGYAVGERPRLPAPRPGDDQERSPLFQNDAELLRIEFFFVIDHGAGL